RLLAPHPLQAAAGHHHRRRGPDQVLGHRDLDRGRRPGRAQPPRAPSTRAVQGQRRHVPRREGPAQGRQGRQGREGRRMIKKTDRKVNRLKRHKRVRVRVNGTSERPRLSVYRSLNHLYVQVIDDAGGRTLASVSTVDLKAKGNGMAEAASVGKAIAEKAKSAGVSQVVFDRGGFLYHGRIKAL